MRSLGKYATLTFCSLLALAQFIRPARTNPQTDPARVIEAHTQMPPQVKDTLYRACGDCHSNKTRWPWYSNVAPASWRVIDHVNHGRRHLNFSTWDRYDRAQAARLISGTCEWTQNGRMPMPSYLRLHPEARLSESDVRAICTWRDDRLTISLR